MIHDIHPIDFVGNTRRWAVPELWPGAEVAILGTGPSLTPGAAESVSSMPRIAVGDAWRLAPDADMLVAHDLAWWHRNPAAQRFAGPRVCGQAGAVDTLLVPCPEEEVQIPGGGTRHVRASGALAMRVAAAAGATRLRLVGFDPGTGRHFCQKPEAHAELAAARDAAIARVAAELLERGVEVTRCW